MQIDPSMQKQLDRLAEASARINKGLAKKLNFFANPFFSIKFLSLKYFK